MEARPLHFSQDDVGKQQEVVTVKLTNFVRAFNGSPLYLKKNAQESETPRAFPLQDNNYNHLHKHVRAISKSRYIGQRGYKITTLFQILKEKIRKIAGKSKGDRLKPFS